MKLAWVGAVTVSLASAQDSGQKAPDAPEPLKTVVTVTARPAAVETSGGDVTVIIPGHASGKPAFARRAFAVPTGPVRGTGRPTRRSHRH